MIPLTPGAATVLGTYAAAGGVLADPMDPPASTPLLVDSGQFAVFVLGLALVVVLLGVIAVGAWRRGGSGD